MGDVFLDVDVCLGRFLTESVTLRILRFFLWGVGGMGRVRIHDFWQNLSGQWHCNP